MVEVVQAEPWHVDELIPRIRQQDKDELHAAAYATPEQCMRLGMAHAAEAWVGLADGVPFCMVGITDMGGLAGMACPWMVATTDLPFHARPFLRESRKMVRRWVAEYEYLMNYVDCRNTDAIRWLKWLGFEFEEARAYGPEGLPFYRFEMGTSYL